MLAQGFRLGVYEIQGPLGQGGMGEVYHGIDTRLGRSVAIKILSQQVGERPARRQRFEREARALAGLSHPRICSLYDIGEHAGMAFLVMEALEGETLADRLARGALSIDELVRHAIEISTALDHAHRHGIIHCDLKPSNVMLTPGGVKLLDFGIARLCAPDRLAEASPLQTITDEDIVMGTPQYMAPEQLEGREPDPRTDIFALGALIYQMAAGRPAFDGGSRAAVIAAILTDEPEPVSAARATASLPAGTRDNVPPLLDQIVARCLAKDPAERWQSAGDLTQALKWSAEGRAAMVRAAPRHPRWAGFAWAGGIALAGTVIGLGIWNAVYARSSTTTSVSRFVLSVPDSDMLISFGLALSPDGRSVVYVAQRQGVQQLFRRTLDQVDPLPIAGTEGGECPFFSPDGQWIGFFGDGALKKVPVAGGAAVTICPAGFRRGASWGAHDTIVFASGSSPNLMQVAAAGGAPKALTTIDSGAVRAQWPELTPDGRAVLYTRMAQGALATARIIVRSLETGTERELLAGTNPRLSPTGHLLFARDSDLWAVPFDRARLTVAGSPTPVLQGIEVNHGGMALFAIAHDGSLLHAAPGRSLVALVDRTGRSDVLLDLPGIYRGVPQPSPDGRRLALAFTDQPSPDCAIWIYDLDRRSINRLTFGRNRDRSPVWTPDGRRIVFTSDRAGGASNLFWTAADGSGVPEQLTSSPNSQSPTSMSKQEPILAFTEIGGTNSLWTLRLDAARQLGSFRRTGSKEFAASISPDGRWLAYESNEAGRNEVYVRPFPTGDGKWQVSTHGGATPQWSSDGTELFYLVDDTLMSAPVAASRVFQTATPRAMFTRRQPWNYDGEPRYAVMPDARHFLMLQAAGAPFRLQVTLNWSQELASRASGR
ncbi:MAG TPA: protein kinase [Vicinamibacterales bacterium]|nr:protein kinase [Vicinamibacterales bacterium]